MTFQFSLLLLLISCTGIVLIDYCIGKARSKFTPSPFPLPYGERIKVRGKRKFLYYKFKKLLSFTPFKKVLSFLKIKNIDAILLFVAAFLILYLFNNHKFVVFNNYSYLARALLQGRIDIPDMPGYLEFITYNGKNYMHFAPGPTLFTLPFVAIFGVDFNINILSIVLGALNIVIFYEILKMMEFNKTGTRLWLSALFGFGTVHFFCAAVGHSWFLGHIAATFFILLAILFAFKKTKKFNLYGCFFTGLFYGLAVTCRLPLLFSFPFFVAMILKTRKEKISGLAAFALGASIPGGLYMLYNYVRFETIMDLGYYLTFAKDRPGETGGPLQLKYALYNLYSIFIMAPAHIGKFPYIVPSLAGVSLTFTTPAFYYALKARTERWFIASLWTAVIATMIPFVLNYGNGMAQFGMRYSMDFTPFLIILTALAMRNLDTYKKILIALCIFVNAWGVLYWRFFIL